MLDEQDLDELLRLVAAAKAQAALASIGKRGPSNYNVQIHRLELKLIEMKAAL